MTAAPFDLSNQDLELCRQLGPGTLGDDQGTLSGAGSVDEASGFGSFESDRGPSGGRRRDPDRAAVEPNAVWVHEIARGHRKND